MTERSVCSSGRRGLGVFLGSTAAGLLVPLVLTTAAWAQTGAPQASVVQAIATFRTVQDMQAAEAAHPAIPVVIPLNLPTMDFEQYRALKATAGPAAGEVKEEAGLAPVPEAIPTLGPLHCNGIGENAPVAGGVYPPDTHGAVGANHYCQVVNIAIRCYSRTLSGNCPSSIVLNQSLASFFNYFNQGLGDPRILYDLTYNRWIVEAGAVQYQFLAVSKDSDPTHGFFFYGDAGGPVAAFNTSNWIGAGMFWDYPQIGYDEDAVILTGNKFNPDDYVGSTAVFFPKHRLYAGLNFSYCHFNMAELNVGTLTPPIVLDQGPYTTVASVAPGGGFVRVTKWNNTSHVCPNFLGFNDIVVDTTVPPSAQQPGPCPIPALAPNCLLETFDGRFQSQGTQVGEPAFGVPVRFWQTRTTGSGSFPVPHAYRVNADTATIEEDCSFSLSGTSFDFNTAIVANEAGTLFVTWSATDPPNNVNAQVRLSGKLFGDACSTIGAGITVNQSGNPLSGNFDGNFGAQRWGDTSAITLDPFDHTIAYGVNEKVQAGDPLTFPGTTWKSYFFNAHNP